MVLPPAWLFRLIKEVRLFLQKCYYRLTPPQIAVFEKSQGFWIAKAIGVACELNLADIIGREALTVQEIAKRSGSEPAPLYRLLRSLAGEGIFKEKKDQVFVNTPFSMAMMDGGNSMKYMIQHQLNETNWRVVNEMKYTVQSGHNGASKILGRDIFEHLEAHSDKNELYNKAMTNTSTATAMAVLSAYNFKNIEILADIGAGQGQLLFHILRAYPGMKGLVFDQEHVVDKAYEMAVQMGVSDRVQAIAGDFFGEIPLQADACILKNILHAFNDDRCISLLKKIRPLIRPANGKVLLIENVIKNDNKPAFGKLLDLQMMIGTDDGKERTAEEFEKLFEACGFKLGKIIQTVSPFSIVEGIKV